MKRFGTIIGFKIGLAIFCACMALSAPAFAEDAKPAGLTLDEMKKALGLSIYVQTGYTYNGNASSLTNVPGDPGSENNLRGYDHKANSFGLDLAEIVFAKDPATERDRLQGEGFGGRNSEIDACDRLGDPTDRNGESRIV